MKDKRDFDNIFKKLKRSTKTAKKNRLTNKEHATTREIVVNWYIMLFENFDNDLIDQN